jgi:hypothetical protein
VITWFQAFAFEFNLYRYSEAAAEHCVDSFVTCILAALDTPGAIEPGTDAEDAFEERIPQALVDAFAASDAEFLLRDIHSGATATIVVGLYRLNPVDP